MERHDSSGRTNAGRDSHNVLLTADHDGAVLDIAEGPEGLLEQLPLGLTTQDIWDEPAAAVVLRGIKRALRGRSSHSAVSETTDGVVEFVFAPQGRDRVLVVARENTRAHEQADHRGRPDSGSPNTCSSVGARSTSDTGAGNAPATAPGPRTRSGTWIDSSYSCEP